LLALVAFADPRELKPWARRLLDRGATTQPAGRVAALGVLRALRDPLDRARLLSASQDPVADVRLAAASALRVQAGAADAMHFLPLLADRAWGVRQEAATALATLPGLAPGALQALAARVADRYGREALERAIAEPPA
jgi:HEAT repeat protein